MYSNYGSELGRIGVATIMILALVVLSAPSVAGENQRFHASTKLVDVAFEEVPAPADAGMQVYRGMMTGVASEGDTPHLKDAQHQKTWTGIFPKNGEAKVYGYDAFTSDDGSFVLISFEGQPSSKSEDGKGRGTWVLVSGTGRFKGATGEGKYTYLPIDETSGTKILEGEVSLTAVTN